VALSPDERWLVTANRTSHTLSLVDVASGRVVDEVPCGQRPEAVTFTADGQHVWATASYSGELRRYALRDGRLIPEGSVRLGFEPHGLALSPDGERIYVALAAAAAVVAVDTRTLAEAGRIATDRWPRYLAMSPDGTRLAVGCSGDRTVAVVDVPRGEVLYHESFDGINAGHVIISPDNQYAYLPGMVYRQNPINAGNIRLGWVLASRIARIRLDGPARREAMSLDPRGEAVADPFGIALTPDQTWLVCSAGGTHELLVYRHAGLPFMSLGGPGDHIDDRLLRDRERFFRIPLGGRPLGIRAAGDSRHVYVANYLLNCVQVVDLQARRVARTIALGGPDEPSLARRGEAIFYDGRRSLDQWYSCHSCHYEGGSNAVTMDTRNDGTDRTFKTVLPLYHLHQTGPWTWHGWQKDLRAAMHKSLTDTMLGPQPSDDDVTAVLAFLETLQPPPNPYRLPDGSLTAAAQRGEQIFRSAKAGCAQCHSGPYFTDGGVHDVGLGSPRDAYQGFNTPSLIGVHRKVRYLHHGRAKSLQEVLTQYHAPENVAGTGALSPQELQDLLEYLQSL
jgi:YVTN family beta-propeller protein